MFVRDGKLRQAVLLVAMMGLGLLPALAGSAVVGSVAGSRDATLSGQAAVANTTVFSGDHLQVRDGVAVVAMDRGSRVVFGRETAASFLRNADQVTVLLGRGQVSMYHAAKSGALLRVQAGSVTVEPAAGYKTLGEVAMLDGGAVAVTAKQGALEVENQGKKQSVSAGKTITVARAARGPMPDPPSSDAHITTCTACCWLTFGAGGAGAVLAGLSLSRSNDAKTEAAAATTAANNATTAANNAAAAANAAGCAIDAVNPTATPSPYVPPTGFTCP